MTSQTKSIIGRGSHLMHADLHGSNQKNVPIVLNQIVIPPFPRHPRTIAFSS